MANLPPSESAQTAVFHTAEILELILDDFSFPDLAACQTISRHFLATISNSSLLSKRLSHETVRTVTLRYIPTSGGAFGFVVGNEITERRLCPVLSMRESGPTTRMSSSSNEFPSDVAVISVKEFLPPSSPFHPNAAWENVYLTNPPVPEATIRMEWKIDTDEFVGEYVEGMRIEAEDGRGLTLGALYEGLLRSRRWTAAPCAWRKDFPRGPGSHFSARQDTVGGSLAKLEEITGGRAEAFQGRCWVMFPRMVGPVGRM